MPTWEGGGPPKCSAVARTTQHAQGNRLSSADSLRRCCNSASMFARGVSSPNSTPRIRI